MKGANDGGNTADLSSAARDASPVDEALRFLERVVKIVCGGSSFQDAVEAAIADSGVPPVGIKTEEILSQLAVALGTARVAFQARRELEQARHGVPIQTLNQLMIEAIQQKRLELSFEPVTRQTADTFRSETEAALRGALRSLIGPEIYDLQVTLEDVDGPEPFKFHIQYCLSRTGRLCHLIISAL